MDDRKRSLPGKKELYVIFEKKNEQNKNYVLYDDKTQIESMCNSIIILKFLNQIKNEEISNYYV